MTADDTMVAHEVRYPEGGSRWSLLAYWDPDQQRWIRHSEMYSDREWGLRRAAGGAS